jgi:hypothetical protein
LFGECVFIHCFNCSLVQHSLMKHRLHHLFQCDWEIHRHLCGITLKTSKRKPFSAFCAHPWAFSEPILSKTCDSLA